MSDTETNQDSTPAKKSKLPVLIGLVLALVGGGGGFYATWSGMILGGEDKAEAKANESEKSDGYGSPSLDIAYVEVDPLTISLRAPANAKHLRFRANLEVPTQAQPEVEKMLPRVVDVLNSYLRAVEPSDFENPAALTRLRAQMLRRVQIVTGSDNVSDLLIMEFVLT